MATTGGKRGLAYNSGGLLAPFLGPGTQCTWSYNWGQVADSKAPSTLEFYPMLWGTGQNFVSSWSKNAEKAIAAGVQYFMSFNECDNAGQANLSPSAAAQGYITYMQPYAGKVKLGTPAITNSGAKNQGVDWLSQFLSACNGQCTYDFCAAHWYNGPEPSDLLNHLLSVYSVCKKPVWLTEFAPSGSDDQINTFLLDVMDQLDNNATFSFVEKYSYFMAADGSLLSSGTTLSSYGNTYAYHS